MLIGEIVSSTTAVLAERKTYFLKIMIIPVMTFLCLNLWLGYITEPIYLVGYRVVETIVYSLFAIGIHRLIILGPNATPVLGNIRLKLREFKYIFFAFLIGLMILPIAILLGLIPFIGPILIIVFGVIIISRFSIILPAIAIDRKMTLGDAWQFTMGHQWTCIIVVSLIPFLTVLPMLLFTQGLMAQIIVSIYTSVIMVFNVGLLSMTYEKIVLSEENKTSSELSA